MYRYLFVLACILFPFFASAQSKIQCISGNCADGYGIAKLADGNTYEGNFAGNMPEGKGLLKKDNKLIYIGLFEKGTRAGLGTEYGANGEIYTGNWINGQKAGSGTLFYADSSFMSATWTNNVPSGVSNSSFGCLQGNCCTGVGLYKWVNGDVYDGEWLGSWRHGNGKQIFSNGMIYDGRWLYDTINGFGTMWYPNGDTYVGNWYNGLPNGLGTYKMASGSEKTNMWKNGKTLDDIVIAFHADTCLAGNCAKGTGSLLFRNNSPLYGATYTGEMLAFLPHGIGELTYPFGYSQKGFYVNGKYLVADTLKNACQTGNCHSGFGEYTWVSGEKYTGFWLDDKRNGWGYNFFDTGNEYEGTWRNNKKHGVGLHTFVNGEKYLGPFRDDYRDGIGTFYFSDGKRFEGQFKKDTIEGEGSMHYPDGRILNGIWKQHKLVASTDGFFGCISGNCFEGTGQYISSGGWQYSGAWFLSNFHGFGRYTDEHGNYFQGMFKNNYRNGFGLQLLSNGASYLGSWKDDMYDGYGVYTNQKDTLKGLFRKNVFITETPPTQLAPEVLWIKPIDASYRSTQKLVNLKFGIRSSTPLHNIQLYVNHKLVYNQMQINFAKNPEYGFDIIIECTALVKEENNLIQVQAINDYGKTESEIIQVKTEANPIMKNSVWIFQTSDVTLERKDELIEWFEGSGYEVNIVNQTDRADFLLTLRKALVQQQKHSGKVILYFAGTVFYLDSINYFIPNLALIQKSCDISVEGISLNQIISDFRHAGSDTVGVIIDQASVAYKSVNYRTEHNYLLAAPPVFTGTFYLMSNLPFSYSGKYMHNYLFRNVLLNLKPAEKNKLMFIADEVKKQSKGHQTVYTTFTDDIFNQFFK